MRNTRRLIPPIMLLTQAACSMRPMEAANPRPVDMMLRVTSGAAVREGSLIFADVDSLVMLDRKSIERITVRPDSGVVIELYQGQRRSAEAITKGAAKGAVVGAAVGVGEALATSLLGKVLGWDINVGDATRGGILLGTTIGAYSGGAKGANEGEAVWERVSLLQIRQQLCRCANPDPQRLEPAVRLIP
jgi:hypothetical protein